MNNGHRWTAAEERAAADLGWAEFHQSFPEITRGAYRIRRGEVLQHKVIVGTGDLEQAVRNNVKVARMLIRLRHSIQADDELSTALPLIRLALQGQVQRGEVTGLGYDELRALIYGQ